MKKVVIPENVNTTDGALVFENGKYGVQVDGTTVAIENNKLVAKVSGGGGLDCEALDNLPIKPWKKGTTVLGKQDGQCVRLQAMSDLFQDIGVGMSANKYKFSIADDKATVTITVTNSGTNTAKNVTLLITKPQGDNYTISNEHHQSQGAGNVVKDNALSYTITNLAKGGNVKVTFDLTSTTADESYQFSAMATVDGIEQNENNNSSTIILNSYDSKPVESNYIPTEDCPLVRAFYINEEKGTEEPLVVYSDIWNIPFQEQGRYLNVVNTENTLQGHKIKLEGASTVIAISSNSSIYSDSSSSSDSSSYSSSSSDSSSDSSSSSSSSSYSYSYSSSSSSSTNSFSESKKLIVGDNHNYLAYFKHSVLQKEDGKWHSTPENTPSPNYGIINAGTFDPDTQIFTFHNDFAEANPNFEYKDIIYQRAITLWVRPAGNNCRWQCINLIPTRIDESLFPLLKTFTYNNVNKVLGAENITVDLGQAGYPKEYRFSKLKAQGLIPQGAYHRTGEQCNWVGKDKPADLDAFVYNKQDPGKFVYARARGTQNPKLEVTVKKGVKCQLTFEYWGNKTSAQDIPSKYRTTGKTSIQINPDNPKQATITVSADAQPTDSVNLGKLKVTVVD